MTIDLKDIKSIEQLHLLFKSRLNFPDWYGMNWDAFWDCITGIVEMPTTIEFLNVKDFKKAFPSDSETLFEIGRDYNNKSGVETFKLI